MTRLRDATMVRIHVPIDAATLARMLSGDATASLEADRVLAAVLKVIRDGSPLGDFTLYSGVAEIAPGWEVFHSGPNASPTLGKAGTSSFSPTAIVTTYAFCRPHDPALLGVIDRVLEVHPWEVPVIEVTPAQLAWREG